MGYDKKFATFSQFFSWYHRSHIAKHAVLKKGYLLNKDSTKVTYHIYYI